MSDSTNLRETATCATADAASSAPRRQAALRPRLIYIARVPSEKILAITRTAGWDVTLVKTASGAQTATNKTGVAAGLIDFSGFTARDHDVLKACLSQPAIGWVALTEDGHPENRTVRELIRNYCFDYITLPLSSEWLVHVLGHARGMAALDCADNPAETTEAPMTFGAEMVGACDAMRQLFSTIRKVANTTASVFIAGESGTGKELTSRAIHELSSRRKAPFVAINCGAIPQHLMQSELFGYERGAFTGAEQRKIGRVEAANGGTLFLDEIGDMPLEAQASLLRFLQEGRIERVGGCESLPVDVRVISATHVDLQAAIRDGRFRADLFHRLCVLRIDQPPLRARGRDIEILAHHILQKYKTESTRKIRGFTPSAITAMYNNAWPGNVRELSNRVRRALVMAEGRLLTPHDLDLESPADCQVPTLDLAREQAERGAITTALRRHGYRIGETATALGISRVTLYRLMLAYGIPNAADS
ncbi:sigma-54 dependent transcriptional regulator [Paraburkholderia ginsengiterrae]|uniref:Sigma-54-dependent Fis family transcriptional regulator n=1 Tax=Paraburkholderia ginsengiterrae TaxID=1462993 RepID=A0A1A9MYX2_9BURK|nr:sigma-54-dependent Fis family transcriptional regulator [Paraburkholderia ginsengiterrae]